MPAVSGEFKAGIERDADSTSDVVIEIPEKNSQVGLANNGAQDNGSQDNVLLDVQNLRMHFPIQAGFFRRTVGHVRAVDDVSFFIRNGETLGLVGESGCGKTTAGRCIMRAYEPTDGHILYRENNNGIVTCDTFQEELKPYRQQIRLIFQDPSHRSTRACRCWRLSASR